MAGFSTRRGRPRKAPELLAAVDRGTPELRQKRAQDLTLEPIDRLFQQGLLTPQEHWCALHLRWLYTLRYGAPTVKACDPARVSGALRSLVYTEWQEEREQEWQEAVRLLKAAKSLEITENCTVYHQFRPVDLSALQSGLRELEKYWCSQNATVTGKS